MIATVFGLLLIAAIVVSVMGVRRARPQGRMARAPDVETLAWLKGGRTQLVDALVTRRLATGELTMAGGDSFVGRNGADVRWGTLSRSFGPDIELRQDRLRREGLLLTADEVAAVRRWSAGPLLGLTGIGLVALVTAQAAGVATGALGILLIVAAVFALLGPVLIDRRTDGGKQTLAHAQAKHDRLRRAPPLPDMALAVALFGTKALAASPLAPFHHFRSAGDSSGGEVTDGGGDGGDGDGGGGD